MTPQEKYALEKVVGRLVENVRMEFNKSNPYAASIYEPERSVPLSLESRYDRGEIKRYLKTKELR